MSQQLYTQAKQKELKHRGIPLNTVITPDNHQLLISIDSVKNVANLVSEVIQRKLTEEEITGLITLMRQLPPKNFENFNYKESLIRIADFYLNRSRVDRRLQDEELPTSVVNLTGLDEVTDQPTITDYQQKELKQLTNDENQFKFNTFQDRRGNAVVDWNRVNKEWSSPDSLAPYPIPPEKVAASNYETLEMVKKFIAPDNISEMIARVSNSYTNYFSINLSHQTLVLDSRNRLYYGNQYQDSYSWDLNPTGGTGQVGNVKIQDPLQQIVQMKISGFWLPSNSMIGNYYDKVRMTIKEFNTQSIQVTEFIPDPAILYYIYEFNITKVLGNRIYLEPTNAVYNFRKPVAQLNKITIQFRLPFQPFEFEPDRGLYTITYANPTVFTINYETATNIDTGDLVYVLDSNSGIITLDQTLTSKQGYYVTRLSTTTFSIPVNSSAGTNPQTNVQIYYGSKRLFIPLEFVGLE
jgi:hypothetical protein